MSAGKISVPRLAAILWVVGLVFAGSLSSAPPANVPVFIGLAGIALIPLFFGSRGYRVFGALALAVSLCLACGEYQSGIIFKEKMRRLLERVKSAQATNSPAFSPTTTVTNR